MTGKFEPKGNIRFCAIAQIDEHAIVASFLHWKGGPEAAVFSATSRRIAGSDKVCNQQSTVITNALPDCTCLVQTDSKNMYLVFVEQSYPQRVGFQFLGKLRSNFLKLPASSDNGNSENCLSKKCKPWMKEICIEFDDVAAKDKVRACQEQVDEVKGIMEQNIHKVLQNMENLEVLRIDAEHLKESAGKFLNNSKALSSKFWWDNARLKLVIAAVGTTIGVGVGAAIIPGI
jgi:hypothetical protein